MYSDPFPNSAPSGGIKGSEQAARVSVDSVCKEVSKPLNNDNASVAKESILVPEEVPHIEKTYKKVAGDSETISDQDNGHANVSKKSYASVVSIIREDQHSTLFHFIIILIISLQEFSVDSQ